MVAMNTTAAINAAWVHTVAVAGKAACDKLDRAEPWAFLNLEGDQD
jgi:hypothetical protein